MKYFVPLILLVSVLPSFANELASPKGDSSIEEWMNQIRDAELQEILRGGDKALPEEPIKRVVIRLNPDETKALFQIGGFAKIPGFIGETMGSEEGPLIRRLGAAAKFSDIRGAHSKGVEMDIEDIRRISLHFANRLRDEMEHQLAEYMPIMNPNGHFPLNIEWVVIGERSDDLEDLLKNLECVNGESCEKLLTEFESGKLSRLKVLRELLRLTEQGSLKGESKRKRFHKKQPKVYFHIFDLITAIHAYGAHVYPLVREDLRGKNSLDVSLSVKKFRPASAYADSVSKAYEEQDLKMLPRDPFDEEIALPTSDATLDFETKRNLREMLDQIKDLDIKPLRHLDSVKGGEAIRGINMEHIIKVLPLDFHRFDY
jgi:hypothetical protein